MHDSFHCRHPDCYFTHWYKIIYYYKYILGFQPQSLLLEEVQLRLTLINCKTSITFRPFGSHFSNQINPLLQILDPFQRELIFWWYILSECISVSANLTAICITLFLVNKLIRCQLLFNSWYFSHQIFKFLFAQINI